MLKYVFNKLILLYAKPFPTLLYFKFHLHNYSFIYSIAICLVSMRISGQELGKKKYDLPLGTKPNIGHRKSRNKALEIKSLLDNLRWLKPFIILHTYNIHICGSNLPFNIGIYRERPLFD